MKSAASLFFALHAQYVASKGMQPNSECKGKAGRVEPTGPADDSQATKE
jgi:hypothetical protein